MLLLKFIIEMHYASVKNIWFCYARYNSKHINLSHADKRLIAFETGF